MTQRTTLTAMTTGVVDGRLERGRRTRQAILERAVDIASVEGLEGLSIGRLATDLAVSKSGVFAHFASKEDLQLAALEAAREAYGQLVAVPALAVPRGVRRVWELCRRRLEWMRSTHSGGCFFYAVNAEFDARPGRVRDRAAELRREWFAFFRAELAKAQEAGELRADVDLTDLAFQLDAFAMSANGDARLLGDEEPLRVAGRTTLRALRAAATDPDLLPARARLLDR